MPQHADHDRYFKKLLEVFFNEFLEAFFSKLHASLDLSTIKFLSQELFPDMVAGDKKRADLIAETKLKERAGDSILLIHIEAQSYHQENFAERMCIYCMMIYLKYRKPVFPIAIFSYDKDRNESTTFSFGTPFFTTLTFQFKMLELHKLHWCRFVKSTNPVAAALMCRMNYSREERVAVRIGFLRSLGRMALDDAKIRILHGFFDKYLKIDEDEEELFMQEVKKLPKKEQDDMLKWPNSFYDRGLKKGREEGIRQGIERGREKGRAEGKKEAVREIATELLKKGMPVKDIAEITGLSAEKIEALGNK